ncbi:hypothetical protein BG74_09505 [Sodalis-like endosymbiont of Proechinophthirus fluctus]|nr:hypothetical protein BG74_09505 [Sodalis-like endosymbiont of Proechinophthirus fluctus]
MVSLYNPIIITFSIKNDEVIIQKLAETSSYEDIIKIFSFPWFISGNSEKNSNGSFTIIDLFIIRYLC